MSISINPIKQKKVYQALKQGKNAKRALLEAEYAEATAHNATKMTVVKRCQEQILEELKAKDVSVEMVIANLHEDRQLAFKKGDIATMSRVDELLGKYLAMFTDRQKIDVTALTLQDRQILDKYIQDKRIDEQEKLT